MWPPFLLSLPAGVGWLIGANAFALFSAPHQLQHVNPDKVFWMPMPIHYVHHSLNQWHHLRYGGRHLGPRVRHVR
jgi:hypothetical protein